MVTLNNLKERRLEMGLSQKECAEKLDIPLRTFQRYERGESVGDVEYLCRIVQLFEMDISELNKKRNEK